MKVLVFDTSTNLMYIGLKKSEIEYDEIVRISNNDHAGYLVDRIEYILNKNNLKIDDIDQIIVGIGPGSYTGIRVSVMVAKMLSYTKNIELKTISSIAFLTSGYKDSIWGLIDARRGYYFIGKYNNGKTIVSDDYKKVDNKDSNFILLDSSNYKVDIENIIKNSKKVNDIHKLEPNYLRKTEAERNYDKKS